MTKKSFDSFVQNGNNFTASLNVETHNRLPAGFYKIEQDRNYNIFLSQFELKADALVDIPSKEFEQVVGEMEFFLQPSTKNSFKELGFLYKRSALLHGLPGTGKTCIVNRISQKVISEGGIVLMNPSPHLLGPVFEMLEQICPNVTTLVVFEEFNETLEDNEEALLSILDGEVQKNNIMYLATTNFIEQIPSRILRPGRFSSVIEIKFPDTKARVSYLKSKLNDPSKIMTIADKTEGFSIDELKEVVLSTECLKQDLKYVVDRINFTKGIVKKLPKSSLEGKMKKQVQLHRMIQASSSKDEL